MRFWMRRRTGRIKDEVRVSEGALQEAVARLFAYSLGQGWRAFHVPNGGRRDGVTGARLKREGVKAGVADFVIVGAGGKAFMIELKTDRGRLSPAQKEWQDWCDAYGFPYCVCRSVDEVLVICEGWGVDLKVRQEAVRLEAEQGMKQEAVRLGAKQGMRQG